MVIIIDRFQVITSVGVDDETVIQSEEKRRRSKLIRNRWWKMVTLANNPSLVLKVLEQNLKNERNNVEQVSLKLFTHVYAQVIIYALRRASMRGYVAFGRRILGAFGEIGG